jgi:heme-degrading monooxygenase HmoA
MYIAMNRFLVQRGQEQAFEAVWRERRSRLDEMPGFVAFHLLRGPEREDHTLYASHTVWADEGAFRAWTRSQQFRDAHRDAGVNRPLHLGHPEFEGFAAVEGV